MIYLTLFSAFFISSVAAFFSIAGLMAIFPGATIAVALMGSSLELAKLVSASWIYRFWNKINVLMKSYFIMAIIMLSLITSVGIFGYLTRAHVEGSQGLGANTEQIALLDAQILTERENISQARAGLQQMDAAVNNLMSDVNRVDRAVQIRNAQRRERGSLNDAIVESNKKIQTLQSEKSTLNVGQRKLETEVGPIKYVAEMVYGKDDVDSIDKAVRLLIFMLIFVFDPLAILLVIAANIQQEHSSRPMLPPIEGNSTSMSNDWNPSNWFKMVKTPKS